MLKFEDLILDKDIRDLYVFESALAHEKKNIGVDAFCKRYESLIEKFREELPHREFCFLLAYLEYFDPNFKYDESVKLDGYIPDAGDQIAIECECEDEVDLEESWGRSIPCFRDRGFLFSEVSGVY